MSSSHQVAPTHQLLRSDSRVLIFYFSSIIIYYLTSPFGLLLHRWIIENIKFALPCCPLLPLLHLPHYATANAANVAANATNTETWARTRLQVLADVSFSENLLKNKKFFLGEKIKLDFLFIFIITQLLVKCSSQPISLLSPLIIGDSLHFIRFVI